MFRTIKFSTAFLFLISQCQASGLLVSDVWARAGKPNSAAFMKITNESGEDKKIVSAKSDISKRVELHDHLQEGDVMKMRKVDTIVLPAGGSVELMPGGKHVMLFDLNPGLTEGQVIHLTLALEDGSEISTEVPVKAMTHNPKLAKCHCNK